MRRLLAALTIVAAVAVVPLTASADSGDPIAPGSVVVPSFVPLNGCFVANRHGHGDTDPFTPGVRLHHNQFVICF